MRRFIFASFLCLFAFQTQAELNIEITQGMAGAVPIAITSFNGPKFAQRGANNDTPSVDIAAVIRNDLRASGRFRPMGEGTPILSKQPSDVDLHHWQKQGVENLVFGHIEQTGVNRYSVSFELWDVFKTSESSLDRVQVKKGELIARYGRPSHILASKRYDNVSEESMRKLAHHISDVVFETLTGIRGAFSTRIAYVIVKPKSGPKGKEEFSLEVADMDGHDPKPLVKSNEPIMSPSWSPDGRKLAFVSFERKRAEIYIIDVATGKRQLLSKFPGINGAPAWSPDGRTLALVLSKDGSPKIYLMDIATKKISRITKGASIDTEPTWAPDGKAIYFTSNRGGKPQIYKVNMATGKTERVTFRGNYNARPSISADGKKLVIIHRGAGQSTFNIATQDLQTGEVQIISHAQFDDSPSIAPNGAMVLYGTNAYGKRVLGLVTIDGRGQLRLPAREGSVQEPSWSPYLL